MRPNEARVCFEGSIGPIECDACDKRRRGLRAERSARRRVSQSRREPPRYAEVCNVGGGARLSEMHDGHAMLKVPAACEGARCPQSTSPSGRASKLVQVRALVLIRAANLFWVDL